MDARQERGLEIAAFSKIVKNGSGWAVPSQSEIGTRYTVSLEEQRCTCPDHETRHIKCKHLWAVEYTVQRESSEGKATITETVKVTYRQKWTAYNAAQTAEKTELMTLLYDLCQTITEPKQSFGRPRLPLSDMLFSAVFKVYSTVSGRRFMSDLADAFNKGYISKVPHFNSVSNYLEMPELTPIINNLITVSSLPLREIEEDFAIDSSGFGISSHVSWRDANYKRSFDTRRDWLKAHLMCGVLSNVVTAVEVTGRYGSDGQHLPSLLAVTADNFKVGEVSADKAYSSRANLEAVVAVGGKPYIPFRSNTALPKRGSVWHEIYRLYTWHYDRFMAHYHKRSNAETTFSMIKRKFGDNLRSKTPTAQVNELLCKVLCHNLCVVIQSIHELEIEPTFCAGANVSQKLLLKET